MPVFGGTEVQYKSNQIIFEGWGAGIPRLLPTVHSFGFDLNQIRTNSALSSIQGRTVLMQ
jgi:hypothetical protein